MPWRRYRVGMILAVPLGAALGVGVQLLTALLPGWSGGQQVPWLGAALGGMDAGAALLGAVAAIGIRRDWAGARARFAAVGALGAGFGAIVGCVVGALPFGIYGLMILAPVSMVFCAPLAAMIAFAVLRVSDDLALRSASVPSAR